MECLYVTRSPDEIVALIQWLPDNSALAASVRGGREYLGWTWDRIVSTLILEAATAHHVDFIRVNTKKEDRAKIKSPEPVKWPGRPLPKKKESPGSFMPIVRALAAGQAPPPLK